MYRYAPREMRYFYFTYYTLPISFPQIRINLLVRPGVIFWKKKAARSQQKPQETKAQRIKSSIENRDNHTKVGK
jgi:hypothetical protein